jgi:hypothetical protein
MKEFVSRVLNQSGPVLLHRRQADDRQHYQQQQHFRGCRQQGWIVEQWDRILSAARNCQIRRLYRDVREGSPLDKLLSGTFEFDRLSPSRNVFLAEWRRLDSNAIDRILK